MRKISCLILTLVLSLACAVGLVGCKTEESVSAPKAMTSAVKMATAETDTGVKFSNGATYTLQTPALADFPATIEFIYNLSTTNASQGNFIGNAHQVPCFNIMYTNKATKDGGKALIPRVYLNFKQDSTNKTTNLYFDENSTSSSSNTFTWAITDFTTDFAKKYTVETAEGKRAVKLNTGEWEHLTVVNDATNAEIALYINGQKIAYFDNPTFAGKESESPINYATYANSQSGYVIGGDLRSGNTASFADGRILKMTMWKDARTASEIATDYTTRNEARLVTNDENVLACYELNSVNKDTLCADKSGNGKNLTASAGITDEYLATMHEGLGHNFTLENATADRIKSEANCESGAVYYKTCTYDGCTAKSESHTFVVGSASGHSYTTANTALTGACVNKETCCEVGTYIYSCAGCNGVDTDTTNTFTVPATGEHTFATGDNGTVNGTRVIKRCTTGNKDIYSAIEGDGITFDTTAKTVYIMDKKIKSGLTTVETMVKIPTGSSGTKSLISSYAERGNTAETSFDLALVGKGVRVLTWLNGASKSVTVTLKNNGIDVTSTWGEVLADGEWHHLAVTVDGNTVSVYIDGVLNNSKTAELLFSQLNNVDSINQYLLGSVMGRNNSNGNMNVFPGEMRSMVVFSDVRTAEEIKTDYETGVTTTEAGLLALYNLTNQTDGILEDLSGNEHTIYKTCYSTTNKDRSTADTADNHASTATSGFTYNGDATCLLDGTETGKCESCSRQFTRTAVGSKTGHQNYINEVHEDYLVSEPTCEEDAVYRKSCEACGVAHATETFYDEGTATGHDYIEEIDEDYLVSGATCTTDAVYKKSCLVCGTAHATETFFDEGTATGHAYADEFTCHDRVCENDCGHTEVATTEHNYDDGVVTTPPTVDAKGVKTFTCEDCGEVKTEEIEKLTPPATTPDPETPPATNGGDKKSGCSKESVALALATFATLIACAFVIKKH